MTARVFRGGDLRYPVPNRPNRLLPPEAADGDYSRRFYPERAAGQLWARVAAVTS